MCVVVLVVMAIPENPSEEEEDGDSMAGFGSEIGDDLRNFSNSPADEADEAETERNLIANVAEAVFEIRVHPPDDACLLLLHAIRRRILRCNSHLFLSLSATLQSATSS